MPLFATRRELRRERFKNTLLRHALEVARLQGRVCWLCQKPVNVETSQPNMRSIVQVRSFANSHGLASQVAQYVHKGCADDHDHHLQLDWKIAEQEERRQEEMIDSYDAARIAHTYDEGYLGDFEEDE